MKFRCFIYPKEQVCEVFGWTAVVVVVSFLAFFAKEIRDYIPSYFRSTYVVRCRQSRVHPSQHHMLNSASSLPS